MQRIVFILLLLIQSSVWAQSGYSNSWEDFYSYNNVLDFYQDENQIIALSDNAIFKCQKQTGTFERISSIQGLSGESSSAFYYDAVSDKIIIGYQNGLVEIIDHDRKIYKRPEITNFSILGSKSINHICANGDLVYLSMPFGIITFDLQTLSFKNTYFIGDNSSEVQVNETLIHNHTLYAATQQGIYIADLSNAFLEDYHNWTHYQSMDFTDLAVFDNQIYAASGTNLYRLNPDFSLTLITQVPVKIEDITTTDTTLTLTAPYSVQVFDNLWNVLFSTINNTSNFLDYYAHTAQYYQDQLVIGTKQYGILQSTTVNVFSTIHPEGPSENNPFSITADQGHLWVVYGGYDSAYTPANIRKGFSHYNGENWINVPYSAQGVNYKNLVHVNLAPGNPEKAYISSWGDGMLIVENNEVVERWNHLNSGLEKLDYPANPNYISIRIGSSTFDQTGNLWVANAWVANRLKKYTSSEQWSSYNLNAIITENNALGLNEVLIDQSGNKWIGTRRNGALVVNEDGTKMMSFTTLTTKGNLPDLNVRCLAVDRDNNVWLGTYAGLRYVTASKNMFDQSSYQAKLVVIDNGSDDGYGDALMGNQTINSICIDGANNKWFGTESSGVVCTNPSGKKTLYQFNKDNSPLPSNKILKIQFDPTNGKVYFATDKGIIAFNSKVAPYSDSLQEVYAYPNPAKSQHEYITIDGRNGTHIPYGTNVKIVDAAGKLVYETNVEEGQELYGGKVVWNKINLAGKKVASGVYIVLLYNRDTSETAVTKIAIIN